MSFGFVELINTIESEIQFEYLPGAIRWADEKYDGAWSKAIERFDWALTLSQERLDYSSLRAEGEFYKRTVLDLILKYKLEKNMSSVQTFLNSIKLRREEQLELSVY